VVEQRYNGRNGRQNEIECGNQVLDVNGLKKTAWNLEGIG
jgi:hypothetical protein